MRITRLFTIILLAGLFLACSGAREPFESASAGNTNSAAKAPSAAQSDAAAAEDESGSSGNKKQGVAQQVSLNKAEQSKPAPTAVERKIIRNADLTLEANSPEESQQKLPRLPKVKVDSSLSHSRVAVIRK